VNHRHNVSGRWGYGLALTLLACSVWGFLPIAVKGLLDQLDPYTINFCRFTLAGGLLLPFLWRRRQLPRLQPVRRPRLFLTLMLCALLLSGNYLLYTLGLDRMTPGGAQVLTQLATILLLLSGVFFFGERFRPRQWAGCAVFVAGLALFFHQRILAMFDGMDRYATGMGLIMLAAVCWASYATLQKQLLTHFTSSQVMLVVYAVGALAFLPESNPAALGTLGPGSLLRVAFWGASTVIGSGAFSEALAHWEASKISALMTTLPLFTLGFSWLLSHYPSLDVHVDPLDPLSITGALLVVSGAILVAIGGGGGGAQVLEQPLSITRSGSP
jgi:drug/metabolite transporter (DMT)-like permease